MIFLRLQYLVLPSFSVVNPAVDIFCSLPLRIVPHMLGDSDRKNGAPNLKFFGEQDILRWQMGESEGGSLVVNPALQKSAWNRDSHTRIIFAVQ